MLAGQGAEEFARKQGMLVRSDGDGAEGMISPRARREWEYWTRKLEEGDKNMDAIEQTDGDGMRGLNAMQDTVGAVVMDGFGAVAAGVSSGGLLLKDPGRIGEVIGFSLMPPLHPIELC